MERREPIQSGKRSRYLANVSIDVEIAPSGNVTGTGFGAVCMSYNTEALEKDMERHGQCTKNKLLESCVALSSTEIVTLLIAAKYVT